MEMVTLPAVAIVRTGTYQLASGETTFTEEDIRAAAEAFATDPAVKAPRIKIASLEKALGLDPAEHGGEPAFGWADNLTVSPNGQELLADIHVPEWISAAMEFAYPSLSIEGTPPGWISATGRKHDLVITAVALLGVHWPGITTIDDFREVLANGPDLASADETVVMARMAPQLREASMDGDLVVRRFLDQLDDGELPLPEAIASSWDVWPRSLRFDDDGSPYLKATDEATGTLYRIDFTVSGNEVTFAEFVEVVEQDVPVAAMAARPAPAVMAWQTRDAVRASFSPAPSTTTEDEHPMNDAQRRAFASSYGLDPETATEADIHTAAETRAAELANEPTPQNTPGATTEVNDPGQVQTTPTGTPEPELTTARTTVVDTETLAELRRGAADGIAARQAQVAAERDGLISAALADGRLVPASSQGWREDLDAAPEVTARRLEALPKVYPGTTAAQAVAPQGGQRAGSLNRVLASVPGLNRNTEKVA